jgi:hypothetical protein
MDQQQSMFPPQEHGQQQQDQDASPRSKRVQKARARGKTPDMPKYEHPSTFEESIADIPPYSYRAQNSGPDAQQRTTSSQNRPRSQRMHTANNDGDAFETGYRPYGPYSQHTTGQQTFRPRVSQSPFPWLRQQPRPRNRTLLIILIVLAILALPVIIQVVGVLIGIFIAFVIGITLFVLFLIALFFILRLILRHYWRSLWGH